MHVQIHTTSPWFDTLQSLLREILRSEMVVCSKGTLEDLTKIDLLILEPNFASTLPSEIQSEEDARLISVPILFVGGTPAAWQKPSQTWPILRGTPENLQKETLSIALDFARSHLAQRTALESANEKGRLTEKEIKDLSYAISHDLRAPLRAIQGFSGILNREADSLDGKVSHYLKRIHYNAMEMNLMVESLLEYSRMAQAPMMVKEITPQQIIELSLSELRLEYPHLQHKIQLNPLPTAYADEKLFGKLFFILLSHSLHFSKGKDPIEIGCDTSDNQNEFWIKTPNFHLSLSEQDRIFRQFQPIPHPDREELYFNKLPLARRIVSRHDGTIQFQGHEPVGGEFRFRLGTERWNVKGLPDQ